MIQRARVLKKSKDTVLIIIIKKTNGNEILGCKARVWLLSLRLLNQSTWPPFIFIFIFI